MMMDNTEVRDMQEKVEHWLYELAGDKVIPKYNVNEDTITELHSISEENKEMNLLAKLLIEDLNAKREEYKTETIRMKEILEAAGLPMHVLSNAGKANLKMLSQLACVLDIKDVKKSSYIFAMDDLKCKLSNISEELSKKQSDTDTQIVEVESTLKELEEISRCYQKLEQVASVDIPAVEVRKKETMKLREKVKGYRKQLEEDEILMKENNLDKQLHHSTLVRLSEEMVSLKEELKTLQTKLQNYSGLPPDIQLAKVKIEELKRYMHQLGEELDKDIDFLSV